MVHYLCFFFAKRTCKWWFQACAHRYRIINMDDGYSWGQGICVLFANDLYNEPVQPCSSYSIVHNFMHQRCQCQAGTSVSITSVSYNDDTLSPFLILSWLLVRLMTHYVKGQEIDLHSGGICFHFVLTLWLNGTKLKLILSPQVNKQFASLLNITSIVTSVCWWPWEISYLTCHCHFLLFIEVLWWLNLNYLKVKVNVYLYSASSWEVENGPHLRRSGVDHTVLSVNTPHAFTM